MVELSGGARGLTVILLLSILFGGSGYRRAVAAQAEPDDGWSLPIDLAATRPGRALFPRMLADHAGGVHVFWTEAVELKGGSRNSVVYAYRGDHGWSGPVDVFIGSRAGGSASDARASVDAQGVMHTVWSDDVGVMYAQRHVNSPVTARSWTRPRLIGGSVNGSLREIQLAQDSEGALHVVFSDSSSGRPGVYYVRSPDLGRTWTAARLLADEVVEGRFRVHLLFHDAALHVALQVEGGVHYLRSDDGGNNWSGVALLQETGSWPQLVGLDEGRLLLLTVGSIGEAHCVKLQNLSPDNGRSWEETEVLFLPVRGCLGNAPIQQDSAGNRHLVMSAYLIPSYAATVWHTLWQGEQWHPAELLLWPEHSYESLGTQPDFPSAAISAGNILHALFMVDEGHIWYTRRKLHAATIPPVLYPTPTIPVREATIAAPTVAPAVPPMVQALAASPPDQSRSALVYLLPMLASLAVVGGAIMWGRRQ